MARDRVNIYLSSDLKKWYQDKADEMGLSMSQLMQFALSIYMEQQSLLKSMPSILGQMKEVMALSKELEEKRENRGENGD